MDLDPRFKANFERLIKHQKLDNLEGFMEPIDLFEEVPLYSRFSQVSFLDGLLPIERNRVLIRAAAWYLCVITKYFREAYVGRDCDFFCMLSILDWEDFNEGDLITPTFWYTNPSQGVLDQIRLESPDSAYSTFVAEALDRDPSFKINEDLTRLPDEPHVERVYVQLIS
ncbi:MAG: Imm15 family immunity protein [Actinomycetota bacterium]|nr:Imm15 family immunity protein [Actinomycetota bacterium]